MDLSFFGEMAWKSALISGAALALAYVLRSRAAADRALVLRLGVAMLLLLPFIALALPALQIEAWAAPEPAAPLAYLPPEAALAYLAAAGLPAGEPTIWDDPTPLVLLAYLGGLLMAGGRLIAGLVLLGRWTRQARPILCPEWLAAFDEARAGVAKRPRLMVSDSVPSPLSWGWRNPVILIDPDTLDEPEEAAAILAHEVAHIERRDWPVLMLTRVAATLFWFNPLVWLLEREVVQQAEEAADREAARCVEPARYARTLLSWAQANGGMVPANSIAPAGSALSRRVKAILDRGLRERPAGSPWTAFAAVLCVAIAAPIAAMQLVEAARAEEAPQAPASPAAPEAPGAPAAPAAPGAPAAPDAPRGPMALDDGDLSDIGPAVNEALAEVLPQIPQIVASATAAIDPAEVERITAEALRAARPHLSREARAEMREAHREAARAMARARIQLATVDRAEIARAVAEAQRAVQAVPRTVAIAMARSATGMERGAVGMERGARNMDAEARRLQDRDYRERQIARARARGETVTHEELLEAAEGLREGAEGMREGAQGMREAARDMRDDASD